MSGAQGINSVEIAITILDALAKLKEPTRAIDLADMTGLTKSRLHKYLVSLCRQGILYQNPITHRYSFGDKIRVLGECADDNYGIYHMMNSNLCQLRDKIKCPTALVVPKNKDSLSLSLFNYNHANKKEKSTVPSNILISLEHTGAGKVFCAFSELFMQCSTHERPEHEYQEIKQNGYYISDEDLHEIAPVKTITCPIFSRSQEIIAAAIIINPQQNRNLEERNLVNYLKLTIEEINQYL